MSKLLDERAQLIEQTTTSLVRIALILGLISAVGPAIALLAGASPPSNRGGPLPTALALASCAAWAAALWRPEHLSRWMRAPRQRGALVALAAAASAGSIALTGGFASPLQAGASWLAWPATVLTRPRVAMLVAATMSVAVACGFLLAGHSPGALWNDPSRVALVGSIFNPLLIAVVGLAIAGMFRRVIMALPGVIWEVERGAPASSPPLGALLRGEAAMELDERAPGDGLAAEQPPAVDERDAALTAAERDTIALLAAGHAPKQIAALQQRTPNAVYATIASAKRKTRAATIEHLVALAWEPAAGGAGA